MAPEAKALGPVIGLGFLCDGIPTGEVVLPSSRTVAAIACPWHLWQGAIAVQDVVDPLRLSWLWPIPVSNRVAHVELLLCKGI